MKCAHCGFISCAGRCPGAIKAGRAALVEEIVVFLEELAESYSQDGDVEDACAITTAALRVRNRFG